MGRLLTVIFAIPLAFSLGFKVQPKIIAGVLSNTTNHPYIVRILSRTTHCSASLINDAWVMTAAHCVERERVIKVSLGIRRDGSYQKTVEVNASHLYLYPGFPTNSDKFIDRLYDIALIKLPHPVQFGQTIQPVRLPANCDGLRRGEAVDALGIGDYYHGMLGGKLREASFNVVDCNSVDPIREELGDVRPVMCIPPTSRKGQVMAAGDSGGPLIRHKDGVQFGVHKGIYVCVAKGKSLGISIKIAFFFDWISSVTGMNLPKCEEQASIY